MPNINKNIIMQAGAAVANATNKAAGLSASTPEPGTIISAIQLVNGGRTIGPAALAHFPESVRNKLLSLIVNMEPIQSGTGEPSPDNVRPISGRTGLNIYVSPTTNAADATTYAVDWTSQAGTVYGGTVDVVTGVLTVDSVYFTDKWKNGAGATSLGSYTKRSFTHAVKSKYPNYVKTPICNVANYKAQFTEDSLHFYVNSAETNNILVFLPNDTDGETDIQVCYELATPFTYQLTPQDIITLVGDNYIWSDSGDVTITE